jgi:hypothetical protein
METQVEESENELWRPLLALNADTENNSEKAVLNLTRDYRIDPFQPVSDSRGLARVLVACDAEAKNAPRSGLSVNHACRRRQE